ncbi:hypothetical protein AAMO2058_000205500 [Amorphochlora amoebiformis]
MRHCLNQSRVNEPQGRHGLINTRTSSIFHSSCPSFISLLSSQKAFTSGPTTTIGMNLEYPTVKPHGAEGLRLVERRCLK